VSKPPPPPPPSNPSDRPTQARADQPPSPPDGTPPPCPNCGAATTEGQQVCLECGHDLTRTYKRAPGRGVWVAAGVAAVLAVGIGAGFAIGALTNDKQKKDVARASTSSTASTVPPATATPTTTTPTVPTTPTDTVPPATATPPTTPTTPGVPPASTPPTTPTTPTTPATPPSGSGIAKWPAGTTGYTVVLISAATHKQANAKAREAKSRGIDAGVLHSNNYSSLNPGYWVVFAGQYSSANEARSHIDEYAGKGFAGGYPRQIKK
jgi:predicted nucleic acid-binding Zn ribbon protein